MPAAELGVDRVPRSAHSRSRRDGVRPSIHRQSRRCVLRVARCRRARRRFADRSGNGTRAPGRKEDLVSDLTYSPLSPEEVQLLRSPEYADVMESWLRTQGPLHGMISMFSVSRPRPLYYFEEEAPPRIVDGLERLRGTPFHDRMAHNVQAAAAIRRMWEERGHTDELH